jgi:hypothetical protein
MLHLRIQIYLTAKKIQSCGGQVMAGNPRPDSDNGVKANECGLDSNPTPQVSAIKSQHQKMKGDLSMKRFLLTAAATALLGASTAFAQVVVRVAPPPPVVEHRPVSPGARYVWTDGYHHWDGHRYVWVSGRWVVPPHAGGVWVPGHWAERGGGWVWIEGHWR